MKRAAILMTSIMLMVVMLLALVWLRDTRVSHARSQLESRIVDGRIAIAKLQTYLSVMREHVNGDAPLESRLARIVRKQNSQLTDEEFRRWMEQNEVSLRERVENDCRLLPAVIEDRARQMKKLESRLDAMGEPWLF